MSGRTDEPPNLIYGLIDPRTLLIRYVGLSSIGLKRPKMHRRRSCPDTYCRRWVKSLQRVGLDYEITILETVADATALSDAERWWIAFGRACEWPLTNITDGGGPSEEALIEKRRRINALENEEALRLQSRYSQEELETLRRHLGIPAEIERRCLQFFDDHSVRTRGTRGDKLIDDVIASVCVTRDTAAQVYAKWLYLKNPTEIERRCFQFFDDHPMSLRKKRIDDVLVHLYVTRDTATQLLVKWLNLKQTAEIVADRAAKKQTATIKSRCIQLFEQGKSPDKVAVEVQVASKKIARLYKEWGRASSARAKLALAQDREELYQRLSERSRQRHK